MTDLVKKQIMFMRYIYFLLGRFSDSNITAGEFWRSEAEAKRLAAAGAGIENSVHTLRLAADLLIRKADGSVSNDKKDYEPLGEYWKALPLLYRSDIPIVTCWGGDFKTLCDYYHFSIEHNGVR